MMAIADRVSNLEKKQIECSTALNGRMAQSEKNETEIFNALERQYKKINSLPWKIFAIIGSTITILLTVCFFVFNISMQNIQKQYEDFTSKIITLEIRNLDNKIERLHGIEKKPTTTSHRTPESP